MSKDSRKISKELADALRSIRGDDVVWTEDGDNFPISSAILREQANRPKPGYHYKDEGIFICEWRPVDREGKSIGKIFNVFAAPEDLMDKKGHRWEGNFHDAVAAVAQLEGWHGHDGGYIPSETVLCMALKYDTYQGDWFIPPVDIAVELFDLYNIGDMTGTLVGPHERDTHAYPGWYWSCTENKEVIPCVSGVQAGTLVMGWMNKNSLLLPCRPVRVVEVKK